MRNRIERARDGSLRAVATGEEEVIDCGLVLRSIGYRGAPLPGVPFDERRGLIRNDGGRVLDDDGQPLPGEYVVGWIKRGPSGVIGTNKKDAADTVARLRRGPRRRRGSTSRRSRSATPSRRWLRARARARHLGGLAAIDATSARSASRTAARA